MRQKASFNNTRPTPQSLPVNGEPAHMSPPTRTPDSLLDGIRVIECGSNITAPFASKLLADLGAEVIKVEPVTGDPSRSLGPFQYDSPNPETSAQFTYLNSNKRGVTLDLDRRSGQSLFQDLLREADIFVENAEPGYMEARDLTYSVLSEANPQLIVTSVRPFGLTGPYQDLLGSDLISWHASALGHRYLGEPDREPLRSGGYFGSYYAAVNAAAATLIALHARKLTGRGQQVDISVADALAVGILGYGLVGLYHELGLSNRRPGNTQRLGVPAAMLPCRDGYVFIFASESYMWDGLVKAMGEPEWAQADIFRGHYRDRSRYGPEIYGMMGDWLNATGKDDIFQSCQENRVPSTAVYNMREVLENVHLKERGFFLTSSHPVTGEMQQPGAPYKLGVASSTIRQAAPTLGQHNNEIFCGRLGLDASALAGLRRAGII